MDPERHVRWSLVTAAAFGAIGIALEGVYGFRIPGFVDDPLRREFLRLGHAHGAILGLANVPIAWALERLRTPERTARAVRRGGWVGALLVGLGFLGGGLFHARLDPGPLILLVPAGGLMFVAVLGTVAWVRPDEA